MRIRFVGLGVLLALLMVVPCGVASATIEIGDNVTLESYPGGGKQGPFRATIYDETTNAVEDSGFAKYLVFCVERDEHFNYNGTYNIDNFSNAQQGLNPDRRLSGYAAWVYAKFQQKMVLEGFDFANPPTPGGFATLNDDVTWNQAMNAYQMAIWAGMVDVGNDPIDSTDIGADGVAELGDGDNESGFPTFQQAWLTGTGTTTNQIYNTAFVDLGITLDDFETDGSWELLAGSTDIYNYTGQYAVMNLSKISNGGDVQDQLFLAPLDLKVENVVPEPTSLAILLGLIGCAAGFRRVRRGLA